MKKRKNGCAKPAEELRDPSFPREINLRKIGWKIWRVWHPLKKKK